MGWASSPSTLDPMAIAGLRNEFSFFKIAAIHFFFLFSGQLLLKKTHLFLRLWPVNGSNVKEPFWFITYSTINRLFLLKRKVDRYVL